MSFVPGRESGVPNLRINGPVLVRKSLLVGWTGDTGLLAMSRDFGREDRWVPIRTWAFRRETAGRCASALRHKRLHPKEKKVRRPWEPV